MTLTKEEFEKMMIDLAECKLSRKEWELWWDVHKLAVKEMVMPSDFVFLTPTSDGNVSSWRPIFQSQQGAIRYLKKHKISFERSCLYQKNDEKEFTEYYREFDKKRKSKEKERLAKLKVRYPELFEKYPRFAKSLKNKFNAGDKIGQGVTEADFENEVIELPADIKAFFQVVSIIDLDGISIDFFQLRTENLCGKEYLVLGEYWKEADGDLLLINLNKSQSATPIYYYAHGLNKVKKLCASVGDLLEKKFSWYNNQ